MKDTKTVRTIENYEARRDFESDLKKRINLLDKKATEEFKRTLEEKARECPTALYYDLANIKQFGSIANKFKGKAIGGAGGALLVISAFGSKLNDLVWTVGSKAGIAIIVVGVIMMIVASFQNISLKEKSYIKAVDASKIRGLSDYNSIFNV